MGRRCSITRIGSSAGILPRKRVCRNRNLDAVMSITGIILARDEEANILGAIASLQKINASVFVVDSGSSDRTVEIAGKAGCTVAFHPWTNHSEQMEWAIANCPFETSWYCRIDADEYFTGELIDELNECLPRLSNDVAGLDVKKRTIFLGRWVRHGGVYPIWSVRFWRKGNARIEGNMDEHIVIPAGRVEKLKHDLVDHNRNGLTAWINKHNVYADREVAAVLEASFGDYRQLAGRAATNRLLKVQVFYRLPSFIRALLFWFYRYILRLGFLDGVPGYLFHFFQACWYRTLVDAKLYEHRLQAVRRMPDKSRPAILNGKVRFDASEDARNRGPAGGERTYTKAQTATETTQPPE
jgi:glycosyltransferase involved in cell wall biosynthesis